MLMITPTEITLHQKSRELEIAFDDDTRYRLPFEFLRVFSPSAEVRGHGPGQEVLQVGKQHVNVNELRPVGSYALKIIFDDGHDTGLYTWEYLQQLGSRQNALWRDYQEKLTAAGASRDSK
ncbi:MAG: gamma-butyrobetaine hydroxylase-like domain-containing protein [Pseudomonadota bacterium]